MTLYTFNIDTNTLEWEQSTHEFSDDDLGECGCNPETCECSETAKYDEDGFENVYAESEVSLDKARALVYNECVALRDKFQACIDEMHKIPT